MSPNQNSQLIGSKTASFNVVPPILGSFAHFLAIYEKLTRGAKGTHDFPVAASDWAISLVWCGNVINIPQ